MDLILNNQQWICHKTKTNKTTHVTINIELLITL